MWVWSEPLQITRERSRALQMCLYFYALWVWFSLTGHWEFIQRAPIFSTRMQDIKNTHFVAFLYSLNCPFFLEANMWLEFKVHIIMVLSSTNAEQLIIIATFLHLVPFETWQKKSLLFWIVKKKKGKKKTKINYQYHTNNNEKSIIMASTDMINGNIVQLQIWVIMKI